jgi:hypothetical protein
MNVARFLRWFFHGMWVYFPRTVSLYRAAGSQRPWKAAFIHEIRQACRLRDV